MAADAESQKQAALEKELFAEERFVAISMVVHRPIWAPDAEKEAAEKLKEAKRLQRNKKLRARGKPEEEKEPTPEPVEKVHVDIANILRGGYPKAKFNAEPAGTGNTALENTCQGDQDFSVVHLKIPEQFVRSINDDTEWTVMSGKHGAREKMIEMAKLLRRKDQELEELEELLNSATESIQAFHLQQKQLFDEFVLLRSNYDDCKLKLRESVWIHACKMSREFSVIPPLLRNAMEDSNTIEQYMLGGLIGTGESSKVRSCKLGMMSGGSRKGGGGGGGGSSGLAKRDLAVKIINKSRVRDVVALQRVANEIRVLREANNINVMSLFDVIHTDFKLYMILERGDRDVFQLIMAAHEEHKKKNSGKMSGSMGGMGSMGVGRVDEKLTQEILKQVLSGVKYLHGMNVCHRDLKPENIVLVEKPGTDKPVVKIIDFGSCAATNGGMALHDLCGTPGFVPPEMILEDAYDGFMGDVWSIGCMALEMTVGHEHFLNQWLPSYNNELVGNRKDFAMQMATSIPDMRNTMQKLVKKKLCSAASQDVIFQALMVNPRKRISSDDFFMHRWVGGKSSTINMENGSGETGETEVGRKNGEMDDATDFESKMITETGQKEEINRKTTVSSVEAGQEEKVLRRRSQSTNNLTGMQNLAKELAKPPTPRRLPPLNQDGGVNESCMSDSPKNGRPAQNLRIDALMANEYKGDASDGHVNGSVESFGQEPCSPALSSATSIMNKGDDILAQFTGTAGR